MSSDTMIFQYLTKKDVIEYNSVNIEEHIWEKGPIGN